MFEIVREESLKVYLHMYNGNVQQNPLCVESCVTKEFSIFLRFSPTMFDPDVNSVLLRAHLCTSVDSMHRKPWVRNCLRERKGLYNGNVQQNPLCASYVTKDMALPDSRLCFLSLGKSSTVQCTVFYTLQPKLMHPADYKLTTLAIKNLKIVLHT